MSGGGGPNERHTAPGCGRNAAGAEGGAQPSVRHKAKIVRTAYGYRLIDAGPHPTTANARWGRRLHRLDPDPTTAPHVQWIFAQRLTGSSVAGIARTLNANTVPPPSAHDRTRNPHRSGAAWTVGTVAAILANPRYTGRQVWNRQGIDHHETRPGDKNSRPPARKPTHHWNSRDQWAISTCQSPASVEGSVKRSTGIPQSGL